MGKSKPNQTNPGVPQCKSIDTSPPSLLPFCPFALLAPPFFKSNSSCKYPPQCESSPRQLGVHNALNGRLVIGLVVRHPCPILYRRPMILAGLPTHDWPHSCMLQVELGRQRYSSHRQFPVCPRTISCLLSLAFKGLSPSTSSISLDHPPQNLTSSTSRLPVHPPYHPQKLPISAAREFYERAVSILLVNNTSGTRPKSPS
ncbi:hypothetical protein F4805DRAFT_293862 [Annulohypoxylon moriforme]|nr:hypothetical protein F4805DRAFT_293862 [Annulohypoxylon moriforme]